MGNLDRQAEKVNERRYRRAISNSCVVGRFLGLVEKAVPGHRVD
jgi:hypothetical protein